MKSIFYFSKKERKIMLSFVVGLCQYKTKWVFPIFVLFLTLKNVQKGTTVDTYFVSGFSYVLLGLGPM